MQNFTIHSGVAIAVISMEQVSPALIAWPYRLPHACTRRTSGWRRLRALFNDALALRLPRARWHFGAL